MAGGAMAAPMGGRDGGAPALDAKRRAVLAHIERLGPSLMERTELTLVTAAIRATSLSGLQRVESRLMEEMAVPRPWSRTPVAADAGLVPQPRSMPGFDSSTLRRTQALRPVGIGLAPPGRGTWMPSPDTRH
jgi:hypothetical protein